MYGIARQLIGRLVDTVFLYWVLLVQSLRSLVKTAATSSNRVGVYDESKIKEEFDTWRSVFQSELQLDVRREIQGIEDRLSKVVQKEKALLDTSAKALHNLAANPALQAIVNDAVAVAESKRLGRVDHAALANGATVVYSER